MTARNLPWNITLLMLATIGCYCTGQPSKSGLSELYNDLEFEMPVIREPEIPDYSVSITDFGAVPGGRVLNTEAFAAAIAAVTERGGGRVRESKARTCRGKEICRSNRG